MKIIECKELKIKQLLREWVLYRLLQKTYFLSESVYTEENLHCVEINLRQATLVVRNIY